MYKEASRQQLRVQTEKGNLSVEQLWDLTLEQLDTLAVSLDDKFKNSKSKSFLTVKTVADKGLKMQFDIVLDILETKKEEAEALKISRENKAHNEEILSLIVDKQKDALKGKSIKDLEKMLKS